MDPKKRFFLKNPPGFLAFETSSSNLTSNRPFWLKEIYRDIKFVLKRLPGRCALRASTVRKKRHLTGLRNVPPKVVIHVHHVDEQGFGGDVLPVFYLFIFFNKENSSLSKSFIFLCIMIVFLVIFWPGRCILRTIRNQEFNMKVFTPI